MTTQRFPWIPTLVVTLVLLPVVGFASQASLPNVFVNGTVADADQVNANFNALVTAVNDNDTRVTALEARSGTAVRHLGATGTPTDNGTALATLLGNLGPVRKVVLDVGTYNVGATALTVPADVVVCGAGETLTVIESTAAVAVALESGARLRDLRLTCAPPGATAIAISVTSQLGGGVLERCDIDVNGSGSGTVTGIRLEEGRIQLCKTRVRAFGSGTEETRGIHLSGATASSFVIESSSVVTAVGSVQIAVDMDAPFAGRIANSTVVSSDTALRNNSTIGNGVEVHHCDIQGVKAIDVTNTGYVQAAASRIQGTRTTTSGPIVLVHCYDNSYVEIP